MNSFARPLRLYFFLRQLCILVLMALNLGLLIALILVLHRIWAYEAVDFATLFTIVTGLLALIPLWKFGEHLLGADRDQERPSVRVRRIEAILLNVLAGVVIFSLWQALPRISEHFYQCGLEAHQQNHYADALRWYRQAVHQDPDNSRAHFALGNLYEDLKQFDEAKVQYLLAIHAESVSYKAYNNLSRLYLRQGEYDDAIDLLLLALAELKPKVSPDNFEQQEQLGVIYKNLASSYLLAGDMDAAAEQVQLALDQFNSSGTLREHTILHCLNAIVAHHQGNFAKGLLYLNSCSPLIHVTHYQGVERDLERKAHRLYTELAAKAS